MSTAVILMIILANYMVSGNEDCCKEVISEVNSLAQKIDEQCNDDTACAGGFILAWLKYFVTISLIALAFGGGVYMRLQLFSLIKSLAEKIDELIKEVKNLSRSGGGTGDKNVTRTRDPASIGDSKKTITGINGPLYIHITDDEKVFITGNQDGYVHIFDKDGNFQKKFKPPTGGLIGVCGKGDRVYVVSHPGKKIYEHTTDGDLIGDKISVAKPVGIAIDSDGNFYVSQHGTGKIHVYNPDGSKAHVITGVAVFPRGIQFDSDNNIRVNLFKTGRVFIIDKSAGKVLSELKIQGVNLAEGLFVDSDDNMYVCDRSSPGEVYICDKNGKRIKVIKGFKGAGDASIAPDGTLWITDFTGDKVYLY